MLLVAAILLLVFGVVEPPWGLALVIAAGMVEIGETGFWVWLTRRYRVRVGAEALTGARAVVVAACRPDGQVRLEGELWRARCAVGADPGERVVVRGREGLTLVVEPVSGRD